MPISPTWRGPEDRHCHKTATLCTPIITKVLSSRGRALSVGKAPEAHFLPVQKAASEAHWVLASEWKGPTLPSRWILYQGSGSQSSRVSCSTWGCCFPLWLCSPPAWKHVLRSLWWLLTRGWGAVVKEFSFLIGEEPLRDGKWSSPWGGLYPPLITSPLPMRCLTPAPSASVHSLHMSLIMQCLAELAWAGTWPRTGPGQLLNLGKITL